MHEARGAGSSVKAHAITDRLTGFAPEDRLLLECSRGQIGVAGADRIAGLIAGALDWDSVLQASIRNGVAPLLRHGLERVGALTSGVPEGVAETLEVLHENSARRNRRLFEALGELVAGLRADGVDAVGLKDIQLAVQIYPNPALRPMGDLDLLIRRDDWGTAAACLARLGFLPRPSADVPYTRRYAPAQHFRRASDEIWIDLQWNVMEREWDLYGEGRFTYDGLGMWRRAVPMQVGCYDLRVPILEDMLFHLCLHLEGHRYSELVLFCDIAELLRRKEEELRWDVLVEIARRYRAESSVYYVLLLTERLLAAPVPVEVLEQLEPAYHHGGLLAPIFANLTPLHLSLDDIRLSVSPPRAVMDELERVVRRQTARALRLEAEVDGLASAMLDGGGKLFIIDGAPSLRLFPDTSLPAFEPLDVYILKQDAPLLQDRLAASQTLKIATLDPALAGEQLSLTLLAGWSSELRTVLSAEDQKGSTNARSALRSLRGRLSRYGVDDRDAPALVLVHPLTADELIVTLAARVGSADDGRLFEVCRLLDALRSLDGAFDAGRITELAERHGVREPVAAGLSIAGAFVDVAPTLADQERVQPPRVLEWARYGPSSMKRYPWLRSAYYFVFTLLSIRGMRARLHYLLRSFRDRGEAGAAVLPAVLRGVVGGVLRPRRSGPPAVGELVHWLEPETAELLDRPLDRSPSSSPQRWRSRG
jgi:Uncharacterised nucleotidyltransferase